MSDPKSKEGCVGRYPALWRFMSTHEVPVRVPDGAGDTKFSHMEAITDQFDVVAETERLAYETFNTLRSPTVYKIKGQPELLCYIDAFTLVRTQ